jgi:RNA polymerase sigma-70 factor (ECF subfamily)
VTAIDLPLGADLSDDAWGRKVGQAYGRHSRQLWEYARRLGHDHEQAEDVAQEAFARLLGLLEEHRPANLAAWLYRAVHNIAIDQHRRANRQDVREIRAVDSPAGVAAADAYARLALWDLVDRLPQRQREAVFLKYRAGLDYATIASILGIGEAGARGNVFRAMETLRKEITTR